MNQAEGKELAERVRMVGQLAATIDEDGLLELLNANLRSLTVGAILSPSAFMAGHERVQAMSDLIRATLKLRGAFEKFVRVVEETEPKAARARAEAAAILGVDGGGDAE